MITNIKLLTPSSDDLLTLNKHTNNHLFQYVKVGLGNIGVVVECTLKCVPEITLVETTSILDREVFAVEEHIERLKNYRHVRYMWIPYTNTVVNVISNPTQPSPTTGTASTTAGTVGDSTGRVHPTTLSATATDSVPYTTHPTPHTPHPTKPLYELVIKSHPNNTLSLPQLQALSFSQLRDILLDISPLDLSHIQQVNRAEAQYWSNIQGIRYDKSVNILGFDCGGEQWVYEVCIPMGPLPTTTAHTTAPQSPGSGTSTVPTASEGKGKQSSKDISFLRELLELIESSGIPAPSPIEQRWTGPSEAYMSPAYSPTASPTSTTEAATPVEPEVFTWVGVIMYLPPSQSDADRARIAEAFRAYCDLIDPLVKKYGGYPHWAKLELPYIPDTTPTPPTTPTTHTDDISSSTNTTNSHSSNESSINSSSMSDIGSDSSTSSSSSSSSSKVDYDRLVKLREYYHKKFPMKEYREICHNYDPHHILSNEMMDLLFELQESK